MMNKEQIATLMVFAWNEGNAWSEKRYREQPLHAGSLAYLKSKVGADFNSLDLKGQAKAKQLMEIL